MAVTPEQQAQAKKVYQTMLAALDGIKWNYTRHDDDLTVVFDYQGDDIPITALMAIDPMREVIRFIAPMAFKMDKDKVVDGAVAVAVANYGMVNGSFDYDISDGEIRFRLTTSYHDSTIGKDFYIDMMSTALHTTDNYNEKFMMLAKGMIDIDKFIEMEKG